MILPLCYHSDFVSYHLSWFYFIQATMTSWLFLKHTKYAPASGHLHWFFLCLTSFPEESGSFAPFFRCQLKCLLNRDHFWTPYIKSLCHSLFLFSYSIFLHTTYLHLATIELFFKLLSTLSMKFILQECLNCSYWYPSTSISYTGILVHKLCLVWW